MIKIFRTMKWHIHQLVKRLRSCWVVLANPTATEIQKQRQPPTLIRMISGLLWMQKRDLVLRWRMIIH